MKISYILSAILFFCAGCAAKQDVKTAAPGFVTAILPTLPPTSTPAAETIAPMLDTATPTLLVPIEGTTTAQVNVRAQPTTASDALGMLNIFTKIQIIGKDSSGKWYQIVYADSFGWVSAEYAQVDAKAEIPILVTAEPTAKAINALPINPIPTAIQDGDSMQMPLASVDFSHTGARVLQLNGDVSAFGADTEDWLQFTSDSGQISIEVECAGDGLLIELWESNARVESFSIMCGGSELLSVDSNQAYSIRLSTNSKRTQYTTIIRGIP